MTAIASLSVLERWLAIAVIALALVASTSLAATVPPTNAAAPSPAAAAPPANQPAKAAAAPAAPAATNAPAAAPAATPSGPKNLVFSYYYYADTGVKPWEVPGNQVSHVIWSFANIWKDGTITLQGPPIRPGAPKIDYVNQATAREFGHNDRGKCACSGQCLKGELYQMFLLKQQYPHLKLIMSAGGWVWSDNFSDVFASQAARAKAIQTATTLMETYGFDGFDWEFPATQKDKTEYPNWSYRPNDHDNLAAFFEETKAYWAQKGHKDWELTAALTGFVFSGSKSAWARLASVLDYGLVMAYEYQHNQVRTRPGAALLPAPEDTPEEQANTVARGLATFLASGFPKSKLVMGIPLYGIGWSGLNAQGPFRDNIPGLGFALGKSVPMTTPTAYNTLMTQFTAPKSAWKSVYDPKRVTNAYFNGSTVWFLDSPQTVAAKSKWAAQQGYGGVMLWNSNQDLLEDDKSMLTAINKVYPVSTAPIRSSKFCMNSSQYCNLRCDYVPPPTVNLPTTNSSANVGNAVSGSDLAGGEQSGKSGNGSSASAAEPRVVVAAGWITVAAVLAAVVALAL
ncbi:hypothetical protein GGF32_006730 [Allomyces javanicus]|nr:hypothetical protein GGF32_006730 [Allomyces javanicus]